MLLIGISMELESENEKNYSKLTHYEGIVK